jgi:hypothetical protein
MLSLIVASWACRVSPTVCNRVIESARSLLNQCLPDIYIYSDHQKDKAAGLLVICKILFALFRALYYRMYYVQPYSFINVYLKIDKQVLYKLANFMLLLKDCK